MAKNFVGTTHGQDITEGSVDVKMDRFRDITVNVTSKELTLDIKDFSAQVVAPALSAIAQAIDMDLLAVGVDKAGKTATVSSTPKTGRYCGGWQGSRHVKSAAAEQTFWCCRQRSGISTIPWITLAKQCYAGDSRALRDAEIGKVYTCETFASENCPHSAAATPGTVTAYKGCRERRIHSSLL